jgi:dolichol-phosphate mannosyltransferase
MDDLALLDHHESDNGPATASPNLSIIIPTLNEYDNIEPLMAMLLSALPDIAWEPIFVDDDSPDGTSDHVRALARSNPRIGCLQRIGRRGLASACIEGVLAAASPYVAVIDADLQHDQRLLPQIPRLLEVGTVDFVVGSRYPSGGGIGNWNFGPARLGEIGTWLARVVCTADITDPLSGFFMCQREVFERALRRMSGQGFKVLLDLLASSLQPVRVSELPYSFRRCQHGESKLDTLIAWEFGMLLADKIIGHIVPVRFALFAMIGVFGLVVHPRHGVDRVGGDLEFFPE